MSEIENMLSNTLFFGMRKSSLGAPRQDTPRRNTGQLFPDLAHGNQIKERSPIRRGTSPQIFTVHQEASEKEIKQPITLSPESYYDRRSPKTPEKSPKTPVYSSRNASDADQLRMTNLLLDRETRRSLKASHPNLYFQVVKHMKQCKEANSVDEELANKEVLGELIKHNPVAKQIVGLERQIAENEARLQKKYSN